MRGPFHSAFGGGVGVRRGGDEPVRPIAASLKLAPDHVDTIDQSHERCVALGALLAGGLASVQWAYYKKHM